MCPKDKWLAARGVGHPWPMFGRPRLLVTDSAKEFKGHAFQRGCEDYGIRIRYRDRGRVHEGGVVERLLGKLNAVLATHPGSAGRSVADRDNYPAERRARLRFADLERCVALAVIDHNQQQNARTLKTPVADWARLCPQPPRFEDDPSRVVLAFLPGAERRLTPQGVSLFALDYYSSGWASLCRGATGSAGLRCDTTPATSATSMFAIRIRGSFNLDRRRRRRPPATTLWEHEADRALRRAAHARSETQKVGDLKREIARIVAASSPPRANRARPRAPRMRQRPASCTRRCACSVRRPAERLVRESAGCRSSSGEQLTRSTGTNRVRP